MKGYPFLPFDPWNHNKRLMWLTQESSALVPQGQMNNLTMENSNTNAGDPLKGAKREMKINGIRTRGVMFEWKGE